MRRPGLSRHIVVSMSLMVLAVIVMVILSSYLLYAVLVNFYPYAEEPTGWAPTGPELVWMAAVTLLGLAVAVNVMQGSGSSRSGDTLAYSDFLARVDDGAVKSVEIRGEEIIGRTSGDEEFRTFNPGDTQLIERLRTKGVRFDARQDFLGVVMQQGRVQLDADWNEWVAQLGRRLQAGSWDTFNGSVVPRTTPEGFRIGAGGLIGELGLATQSHRPAARKRDRSDGICAPEMACQPEGLRRIEGRWLWP